MADLPTDTTSHTTMDITVNTIQNLRQEAFVVLTRGEFQRAIEILSRMIAQLLAQERQDNAEISEIYSYRAGCYVLYRKYRDALDDCEESLRFNRLNATAYINKCKALIHLNKVNDAEKVIKDARSLLPEHVELVSLENEIQNRWFTLGHAGVKSLGSIAIGVIIGMLVNKFSTYSSIKQGIIAGGVSAFVLFIHLRRLCRFTVYSMYTLTGFLFGSGHRVYNWLLSSWQNQLLTRPEPDATPSSLRF